MFIAYFKIFCLNKKLEIKITLFWDPAIVLPNSTNLLYYIIIYYIIFASRFWNLEIDR